MMFEQFPVGQGPLGSPGDILGKLRTALFGKGLARSRHTCKCGLTRPQHATHTGATAASPRPLRSLTPGRIIRHFIGCGPTQRMSEEGVHVSNWPSIHPSTVCSPRASCPASEHFQLGENVSAEACNPIRQQQVDHSCNHVGVAASFGKQHQLQLAPAQTAAAVRSCAAATHPAQPVSVSCIHSSHSTAGSKSWGSTPTTSNRSTAENAINAGNGRSRTTSRRRCDIHPEDIAIIAHLFDTSPTAFLLLPSQQQQHMMVYAQHLLGQKPHPGLDPEAPAVLEEKQEQQQQQQQQQQQSWGQKQQQQGQEQALPRVPFCSVQQPYWLPVEHLERMSSYQLEERRRTHQMIRMAADPDYWPTPDPEPLQRHGHWPTRQGRANFVF